MFVTSYAFQVYNSIKYYIKFNLEKTIISSKKAENCFMSTLPPDRSIPPQPHLADVMQIVMRIGVLMLRSGTVSFRVEQAMSRAAVALGAERLDAYVTLGGIMASIHYHDRHYTQIARIKNIGVDMNRLSAVEQLSQTIPSTANPQTVAQVLDKIESVPPLYPLSVNILLVALACGAFAALNEGGVCEFIAATIGAGCGQRSKIYLQQSQLNLIAVTVICAAVATLFCHLTFRGLAVVGLSATAAQAGFLAAVIFQVPGMSLVTAALDLVRFDLVSGIIRTAHALLIMFSVAIGVLLVLPITGVSIL